MKNKITMQLTWHNCLTHPPKEFANNALIVTNGSDVFGMSWHQAEGYFISDEDGCIQPLEHKHLNNWYWADIEQTVQNEVKFKQ